MSAVPAAEASLRIPFLVPPVSSALPWVQVAPGAPYFLTEDGQPWTPIGQNDAITWPDLAGLFQRRNVGAVEGHLAWLASHGVTCLRLMLEYCQTEHRYLERPLGHFQPNMVRLWDDLFALCEKHGLRLLLTPYDTYWMWRRWRHHPYHQPPSGPAIRRSQWLRNPQMRAAIKQRLTFAAERWGGSGALFGWDLWNELHPAHAKGQHPAGMAEFVADLSQHLRAVEQRCYGRSHPQTVSVFGPVLQAHPGLGDIIFRHPQLDFATSHFYEAGTINQPRDTLGPAQSTGRLVGEALAQLPAGRPFFDTEHGPIDAYKQRRPLPEVFDDAYFRHMQWAHLAAGGAGGGLRWPYRQPHVLTHGMRAAQRALAEFAALLDWPHFQRRYLGGQVQLSVPGVACFACADTRQAVVWLLREAGRPTRRSPQPKPVPPIPVQFTLPGLQPGAYLVHLYDTATGQPAGQLFAHATPKGLVIALPALPAELALAIVPRP